MIRFLLLALLLTGCTFGFEPIPPGNGNGIVPAGETATVVSVIDGDTIDVMLDGQRQRVRYIGINTPERDEPCYADATRANESLVDGRTITMVIDTTNTDRFDRLLRYIYVGDTFVNAELIRQGYAEAVSFPPNVAFYDTFRDLEREAARANLGCHPTGIFNDGTYTR